MRKSIILAAALAVAGVGQAQARDFSQAAYFKGDNRDRIFVVEMASGVTAADARRHAEKKMRTPGQMTAVYFFEKGVSAIPRDGVTMARDLWQANDVLYEIPGISKWRYAYMMHRSGIVEFVDCAEDSQSAYCRE